MNIASHFYLYKRNWISILLITLIALATSIVYTVAKNPANFDTTLFLSIGYKQSTSVSTSFDNVQAADYFSETVEGWFKNPQFTERIKDNANLNISLAAKKQEKQNLVITFSTQNNENANTVADAITTELKHEIQRYNTRTGSDFQLAIQSISTTEKNTKSAIIIIIGLILGFIIALALTYIYEFTFNLATFKHQVENILGKENDDIITPLALKNENFPLLKALLENQEHKNTLLIGISFEPLKIEDILTNDGPSSRQIKSIRFPQDSAQLTKSYNENVVIACRLGKTSLQDLERIKKILPSKYLLVTVY